MLRKIVFLGLLAAGFWSMFRLNEYVKSLQFTVTAAPGELVYAATFDDFLSDWLLYDGRLSAEVVDSALHLTVDNVQRSHFSTITPNFTDFDLRVTTHTVAGPVNNGYGVVFRLLDDENFYWFMISSDGYYQVLRQVNGRTHELSTWIDSPVINQGIGAENYLRVVGQGNQFQFFINDSLMPVCVPDDPAGRSTYYMECIDGQMLNVLTDDTFAIGQLGVVTMALDEPGVEVAFDNVLIYGADGLVE